MTKIKLNILKGKAIRHSTLVAAEHFKKIPNGKILSFMNWTVKFRAQDEIYTEDRWKELRDSFDFKSIEEFLGATKFAIMLIKSGPEIERADLKSDFEKLDFAREFIELIINCLESIWGEYEDWLKRERLEALPILASLRWRVDIRYASSNFLKKPEPVAILRIGTDDGSEKDQIYFELNREKISWLESIIGKMKREFLKAEERMNKNWHSKS